MSQGELPEESMGYVEDATADKAWDACKQDIVAWLRRQPDSRRAVPGGGVACAPCVRTRDCQRPGNRS